MRHVVLAHDIELHLTVNVTRKINFNSKCHKFPWKISTAKKKNRKTFSMMFDIVLCKHRMNEGMYPWHKCLHTKQQNLKTRRKKFSSWNKWPEVFFRFFPTYNNDNDDDDDDDEGSAVILREIKMFKLG